MNKYAILSLSIVALVAVNGCKKSKSTTPDPVITRGMSAKINGVPWTAKYVSYFSDYGSGVNYIDLSGYDSTGRTIDLRINNFMSRGTFNVPRPNDSAFFSLDYGVLASPLAATTGSISILAVNDTAVGGTFSFTADTITVTEGSFYWTYK